jgi:hypothetical protein
MKMVTFHSDKSLSIDQVRERFGLSEDEIDREFGVIEIDPADGTFAIMIADDGINRNADSFGGPFSDPPISPFGPPS